MKWVLLLFLFALILSLPSSSMTQTADPNRVYKVAILPFLIHSQENLDYLREGVYDILASRVSVEGRIEVVERTAVERALYEERPMRLDEAVAQKIGMRVQADYVVLGSLTKIGDYISLDARLINVSGEKPPVGVYAQSKGIEDVMVKIGDFAGDIGYTILGRRAAQSRSGETRHPYLIQPRKERIGEGGLGLKRSQTFNFEIRGLDIGDVNGDKKNELVLMDSNNVYVFKYDGEKMTLLQKIEGMLGHNFLTLDVADLNRNGYAEIVVTSVVDDDVRSFILEYEEGRFRKIHEKSGWFYRVLNHPKDGPILMGQQRGSDGLPTDPVYKMVWKGKSFERGPKMDFPKDIGVFGLTMADIRGKGKPEIIRFDGTDHLSIFSDKGKVVWRSFELFGGTSQSYDTKKKLQDDYRDDTPWRVYIPGRILVKDLNRDGVPQLIVNKNEFSTGRTFTRVRVYERGEVHCLVWDENEKTLVTDWKTRELKGYLADYQVNDVDNEGNEDLVVALVNPATSEDGERTIKDVFSRKYTSQVLFFKLF